MDTRDVLETAANQDQGGSTSVEAALGQGLAADRVAAALERMQRLHPKRIDLSLGRMERLLGALGHPERRLPPVVHVAGTNGKGSTVAFLRAMLEAAGYRVDVYTSPHLVRFAERIRLAGSLIEDERLADLLARVEAVNAEAPITFFEVTTCAAFVAFARDGWAEPAADIVLLEVGLGGRLDATNVVERPAATAITRISIDHTQFLGDTVEEIAAEKAGILKAGVPAIVGPQRAAGAVRMIEARAVAIGAPLRLAGRDWWTAGGSDRFALTTPDGVRRYPLPTLPGAHQIGNAATAILCLDALVGFRVPDEAVRQGLARVEWPARLQRLTSGPLAAALPGDWELWLDGGHNDSAGEVLAVWAAGLAPRPLHLVVGMLETKDAAAFLRPLARFAAGIATLTIPDQPSAMPAEALAAAARGAGLRAVRTAPTVAEALAGLDAGAGPSRVLICGSLYLAGSVLAENG